MTSYLETPVGQLVVDKPQLARVFEKFGIDYCCGGKLTLGAICQKKGLDVQAVLTALDQAQVDKPVDETDWNAVSVETLARHILDTHHVYLKENLPTLAQLAQKVARVHGENHPELIEVARVYHKFQTEMNDHLAKEEQILFPAILQLVKGEGGFGIQQPIRVMLMEHDAAGQDLEALRTLTKGFAPPEDACYSYRTLFSGLAELELDTHTHIHKENNILFPKALALLETAPTA